MEKQRKNVFQLIAMLLTFAVFASFANVEQLEAKVKSKENVVILYFSATGTTEAVAKRIKKTTEGNLIEVKAKEPYTEENLDYGDSKSRVVQEHESAKTHAQSEVRPEISNLKAIKKAVKKADVVYIGYPIWWGEAPHIMYNLVEQVSLEGKTIVPFCTSISSGIGSSAKSLKVNAKISSKTIWLKGRNFYNKPSQKTVDKWVEKLNY